jgi:hypothetical protein
LDVTEPDLPDIDRRLREAFGDDAAAAARVARIALSEDQARGRGLTRAAPADADVSAIRAATSTPAVRLPRGRRRWAAVAAGAAVLLVASALALWPGHQRPEPAAEAPGPPALTGVLIDGALVVSLPDGSTSISWGGARDDRPPDGSGIVLVEGAIR